MLSKRVFDICFSVLALLVVSPLLAALAVWVKLDSPGPVFFRQVRVGRFGREFSILKLRTMRIDAAAQELLQITVGADPRITRAGRFLRKYKLDELPQFLNVLAGDMSVVGPRPEVPKYVALYPPDIRDVVLSLRPGVTDPASLAYRDEATLLAASEQPERTYMEVILPVKLRHAVAYQRRRSLRLDLVIVWQTVLAVFGRTG